MKSPADVNTEINRINIALEVDEELDPKGKAILNTRKRTLLWVMEQSQPEAVLLNSERRMEKKRREKQNGHKEPVGSRN